MIEVGRESKALHIVAAMIDRDARDELATLIRRYLDEQLKAFDFDEALDEFRDSNDTGVRFVAETLWYYYDDCDDHLIVASKPEWNCFQRLLLLLESNSTVTYTRNLQWSITQLIAATLLIVCVFIAIETGIGSHLLIFFIPFGLGSIVLSHFRRPSIKRGPYHTIVAPFDSIGDLRIAYNSTWFRKRQYPKRIDSRLIRSPTMSAFWLLHSYVIWAILAPVPLLVQCFPVSFIYPTVNPE